MKKTRIFILMILLAIIIFLLFPRKAENAVVIKRTGNYIEVYVDGKHKKIRTSREIKSLAVINYYYNYFINFDFKIVNPINERIMVKNEKSYDLEKSGDSPLASKTYCYLVSKDGSIKPASTSHVIIGKNTVNCFKDSNGKLKTFIVLDIDYSTIRVGISTNNFSGLYHDKIDISSAYPINIYSLRDNLNLTTDESTKITVEKLGSKMSLKINNKIYNLDHRIYFKGTNMTITNIKRGAPSFNPSYSNILEFEPTQKGVLLLNELSLEEYLKGVVPSEMPINYGIEALKCQAVAARTYAAASLFDTKYTDKGFYLDDSTSSQVFNNIQPKNLSNEAIKDTEGLIMTYKDEPLDAKYYSTSCGSGASYSDVFFRADGSSDKKPYLLSNNYLLPKTDLPKTEEGWLGFYKKNDLKATDSISPYFRWSVNYSEEGLKNSINSSIALVYKSRKDFITIMKGKGSVSNVPKFNDIKDIKIVKRGPSGNIKELYIYGSNLQLSIREDYTIRSIFRCTPKYTGESTVVSLNDGTYSASTFLPSSFFSIEKKNDSFKFYGGGYGHGTGMSQYGAMYLSKQGTSYKDILDIFYKNFKLNKAY